MAMRKTSTLALTFEGLPVNIPIGLYKAVSEKDLAFNNLHRKKVAYDEESKTWKPVLDDDGHPVECGSRIKTKKYCPVCNPTGDAPELTKEELVKGYEISKGNYVKLEESDFDAVPISTLKEIHVLEFVTEVSRGCDMEEYGTEINIDPRYYEESYFVAPEPASARIFSMMFQAANEKDVVAICKIVLREKEHIAILRPFDDGIFLLQLLYWSDELKDHSELKQKAIELSEKELGMATKLIEMLMVDTFDVTKYKDNYREGLISVVEAKAAGEIITPLVKAEAPAGDGLDALAQALDVLAANKKTTKARK